MNATVKAIKKNLESVLSKVAGIEVEITFARTNMVTICWDGENETAFEKLQKYLTVSYTDMNMTQNVNCPFVA